MPLIGTESQGKLEWDIIYANAKRGKELRVERQELQKEAKICMKVSAEGFVLRTLTLSSIFCDPNFYSLLTHFLIYFWHTSLRRSSVSRHSLINAAPLFFLFRTNTRRVILI